MGRELVGSYLRSIKKSRGSAGKGVSNFAATSPGHQADHLKGASLEGGRYNIVTDILMKVNFFRGYCSGEYVFSEAIVVLYP